VRVLGNQLGAALPSVEYGVSSLHTPVLLIIGHTGCEAAARAPAAADEHASERPKRSSKGHGGKDGDSSDVVIANVNAQVKEAVGHFAGRVQSGDLTVIGAVYDVTNELGKGAGRLHLVNINGNVDAARVKTFEDAVNEQNRKAPAAAKRSSPDDRARAFLDGSARLPPGSRATINAVSVVGNGGFDSVTEGSFRQPVLGAPHDVKPAFAARRPSSFEAKLGRSTEPSTGHGDEHAAPDAHGSKEGHGKAEAAAKELRAALDPHAKADSHADPHAKADSHADPHAKADAHAAPEKPERAEASGHADEPAKPAKPTRAKAAGGGRRKKANTPSEHGGTDTAGGEPTEPPPLPWK
jgi:carbonic anhydrase-like protein